jgi:hypothetical protein
LQEPALLLGRLIPDEVEFPSVGPKEAIIMSRTSVVRRRVVCVTLTLAIFTTSCGGDARGDAGGDIAAEGEDPATSSRFIGLVVDDAAALAESEGRQWRISRDGAEFFAMDAALVEGRVTFEVDDGTITSASIESTFGSSGPEPDDDVTDDPVLAQSLQPLALELIAESLQGDALVKFTQSPDAEIADLTDREAGAAAVAKIEDVRAGEDRAEIDLSLWCGNVCGVYLTYEAELDTGRWNISGTAGPIAVA